MGQVIYYFTPFPAKSSFSVDFTSRTLHAMFYKVVAKRYIVTRHRTPTRRHARRTTASTIRTRRFINGDRRLASLRRDTTAAAAAA